MTEADSEPMETAAGLDAGGKCDPGPAGAILFGIGGSGQGGGVHGGHRISAPGFAPSPAKKQRGPTKSQVAEGVGFEPTVSCPTFDFESSALNRAQPPFRLILNVMRSFQDLEIGFSTVPFYSIRENRTLMDSGPPKQAGGTPTIVQFLYKHRNGRYYVRTYSGSKPNWISLRTTPAEDSPTFRVRF